MPDADEAGRLADFDAALRAGSTPLDSLRLAEEARAPFRSVLAPAPDDCRPLAPSGCISGAGGLRTLPLPPLATLRAGLAADEAGCADLGDLAGIVLTLAGADLPMDVPAVFLPVALLPAVVRLAAVLLVVVLLVAVFRVVALPVAVLPGASVFDADLPAVVRADVTFFAADLPVAGLAAADRAVDLPIGAATLRAEVFEAALEAVLPLGFAALLVAPVRDGVACLLDADAVAAWRTAAAPVDFLPAAPALPDAALVPRPEADFAVADFFAAGFVAPVFLLADLRGLVVAMRVSRRLVAPPCGGAVLDNTGGMQDR